MNLPSRSSIPLDLVLGVRLQLGMKLFGTPSRVSVNHVFVGSTRLAFLPVVFQKVQKFAARSSQPVAVAFTLL